MKDRNLNTTYTDFRLLLGMKYRYELDQLRYNASKATGIDECENKQASSVKRFIQP